LDRNFAENLLNINGSETQYVTYADFEQYNIGHIDSTAFGSFNNLQYLSLEFNLIITLDPYTFNGLSNLQNLILSNNKLTTLMNYAFNGLSNLQSLG